MKGSASPLLKVGTLAARTGLSIRTLHHYDEIGLLSPSSRTPSGHRLYDVRDVATLQQIQALRTMGLSLDEIGDSIRANRYSPREIVRMQIERLTQQLARQQDVLDRLHRLEQHFASSSNIAIEEFFEIIDATRTMDKYFTAEQLTTMYARGSALGMSQVRAMQAEWNELIPAVRAHWQRGTPRSDPEVQALARRWRELLHRFTQGDAEIAQRLAKMAAGEPGEGVPEPGLVEFINTA